jgi:hypothetical protein
LKDSKEDSLALSRTEVSSKEHWRAGNSSSPQKTTAMEEFFYHGDTKLEVCCQEINDALLNSRVIRFTMQAWKTQRTGNVKIWIENQWKTIDYCPFCGVKFNIIGESTPGLKPGEYMLYTGMGKSRAVPASLKDMVIIDHLSLIDVKTTGKEFDNGKVKDFVDIMKVIGRVHYPEDKGKVIVVDTVTDLFKKMSEERVKAHESPKPEPRQKKNPHIKANSEPWKRGGKNGRTRN